MAPVDIIGPTECPRNEELLGVDGGLMALVESRVGLGGAGAP